MYVQSTCIYVQVFKCECVLCFVYVTGVRINNEPGDVILESFVYYKKYKYLREHTLSDEEKILLYVRYLEAALSLGSLLF